MATNTDYAPYRSGVTVPLAGPSKAFTDKLREDTAGVRLSVSKFGVRKALSRAQVQKAATPFGAEPQFLSASKKLIDTHFKPYQEVTKVISQARSYWRTMTVYFPIDGIRLIRKSLIPVFREQMEKFQTDLNTHLNALEGWYTAMRTEGEARLGELFNAGDYPTSIRDTFAIEYDFPSVEPPDFLKELNPDLYEQERQKIAGRFDDAFAAAEQAMTQQFQGLVDHLLERLQPGTDGKPKVLRASAVDNVREFIDRFRSMAVTDNAQLLDLVEKAESILGGVDPAELRKQAGMQKTIGEQLAEVKTAIDGMIEAAPTRLINLQEEDEGE